LNPSFPQEALPSGRRADAGLRATVILLDQIIEIFRWSQRRALPGLVFVQALTGRLDAATRLFSSIASAKIIQLAIKNIQLKLFRAHSIIQWPYPANDVNPKHAVITFTP
jgi:hypothetical protein